MSKRRECEDCGATDFLHVIRVWCIVCDPISRCLDCHRRHSTHRGVKIVHRGKAGPAYMRAS